MPNTYRFFSIILLCFISWGIKSQCPLDLDETTVSPTNNLLLHLEFDGNLTNQGSGNYSIVNSGAQFMPTQCGQGLFFDGNDDFVSVSPSMNLVNDFTVCAWISPNSQLDPVNIFSIREQCTSNYRGYSILQFTLGDYGIATLNNLVNIHQNCNGWSAGDRYTNSGISIPNNTETFVALSVQNNLSENRVVKLYVNCGDYTTTQIMDYPTAVCFNGSQNYTTTIGASSGVTGHTNSFHGTIDQLRVYDVVLTQAQMLDVYQSCLPVTIDVVEYPDCNTDSAAITIFNTELDVNYQLFNASTNTPVGPAVPGNCGTLTFNTGVYTAATQFQISATNTISGCAITLDTTISLSPSFYSYTGTQNVTICTGDSIQISSGYITSAGTYTDTIIISPTCDSIITMNVSEITPYSLNLGPDIQICPNATQMLTIPPGADSYLWQDASILNTFQVTQSGTYWVTASDQCGTYSDTIVVSTISDNLDLGPDTSICSGASLTLDATTPLGSYIWNDNSTSATNIISSAGTYWVVVNASNCVFTDSIVVTLEQLPSVNMGNDTTVCEGDVFSIVPSILFVDNYLWSTMDTTSSIAVYQSGVFWLEGTNACGSDTDSIAVTVEPIPYFDLGNDTTLCEGTSLLLTANVPSTTTIWQDGSILNSFEVSQTGIYTAIVSGQTCSYKDTIQVSFTDPPFMELGADTSICEGEQYFLLIENSNGSIHWNNGSQESFLIISEEGTYSASVTNSCGQIQDEIEIQMINCSCDVYIPNSFTPNGGKFNEEFGPVHECEILVYDFKIYNRWGEVVFESSDPLEMWDATYQDKKVQVGTYTYKLIYSTNDEEGILMTGHVNVLY